MKQFGKILKFELKSYFKNKIFVGTTVFLAAAIALVMCWPLYSGLFSRSEKTEQTNSPVMLVKPYAEERSDLVGATFAEAFASYEAFSSYDVQITNEDTESIQAKVASEEVDCAFVLDTASSFVYYVNNFSMYDSKPEVAEEAMRTLYQTSALLSGGMTTEEASAVMNIHIEGSVESLGKNQAENFFYTYIMIFALYMVIMLYGQMVATNVATEKSSRAMEVLITSAKPVSMMFGKVLASCVAGFVQILAVFGSALIFYNLNLEYWQDNTLVQSIFSIPPELLMYMLIFFVLGFLIYAFLYGAIGSTATKVEDINTSTVPLTLLFVVAFIVVMTSMSSGNVENTLMIVCSYIPFTSPMAMFTRIAMSTVPMYEIVISIAVLIASSVGIGVLSAKIYRVGVLLYGTTPKIGAIIKALKKA